MIDASQTNNVHFDVLEIIDDFEENAKTRNIKLERKILMELQKKNQIQMRSSSASMWKMG